MIMKIKNIEVKTKWKFLETEKRIMAGRGFKNGKKIFEEDKGHFMESCSYDTDQKQKSTISTLI